MFKASITYFNDEIEQVIYESLDSARHDIRNREISIHHDCGCEYCEEEESYGVKSVQMMVNSVTDNGFTTLVSTPTPVEFRWKDCPFPPGELKRERKHGEEWVQDFGGIYSGGSEPIEFRYFINGEPLNNVVADYKKRKETWWDNETIPWSE